MQSGRCDKVRAAAKPPSPPDYLFADAANLSGRLCQTKWRATNGFLAYLTVGLSSHTKAAQEGFERAIARAPEVREVHNITGSVEYLLRVEARDLAHYKHFHTDVLGTLPDLGSITTFVVLGSPKDERA